MSDFDGRPREPDHYDPDLPAGFLLVILVLAFLFCAVVAFAIGYGIYRVFS